MIPYKFFALNVRDQTGVLLSSIHRESERVFNGTDIDREIFQVPSENGFLLSSYSIECEGSLTPPASTCISVELQIKDAQGIVVATLADTVSSTWLTAASISNVSAITRTGSPIAVIGPGLRIFGRCKLNVANAANRLSVSINGVLIPHGTMAYQQ